MIWQSKTSNHEADLENQGVIVGENVGICDSGLDLLHLHSAGSQVLPLWLGQEHHLPWLGQVIKKQRHELEMSLSTNFAVF